MAGVKRKLCCDLDNHHAFHKEMDEVLCPICMDHPHNAVRILCSSHEKGCRSYICDTSYRHSNCLDRFKKLRDNAGGEANSTLVSNPSYSNDNDEYVNEDAYPLSFRMVEEPVASRTHGHHTGELEMTGRSLGVEEADVGSSLDIGLSLKCPLCRGAVLGFEVVEEARKYLNLKTRSCSRESCSFSGNYRQLRIHARTVHPTIRPSDIDPSRERDWRRLERQNEVSDIVSAIRSAIPGAVVVGDYAIEDRFPVESQSEATELNAPPWWDMFFLFQMIAAYDGEPRARSRAWTRHRRPPGALPERRLLWGENLLGLQDDVDDGSGTSHISVNAGEDDPPNPGRRRRLNRSRSDDHF